MIRVMERLARRHSGVTLVELLIVIVVLAVLSTIAVTTYRSFTLRANRTDATTTLLRIQVAQEKFFLQNNRYASGSTGLTDPPPAGLGVGLRTGDLTPNGYYAITLDAADDTHYTATAAATGGQTQDKADCQTFTLNQQGTRTPAESSGCWK
jgi:type IV pilus assembly protein PilE